MANFCLVENLVIFCHLNFYLVNFYPVSCLVSFCLGNCPVILCVTTCQVTYLVSYLASLYLVTFYLASPFSTHNVMAVTFLGTRMSDSCSLLSG